MEKTLSTSTRGIVEQLTYLDARGVAGIKAVRAAVSDRSLGDDVRSRAVLLLQLLGDRTVCNDMLALVTDAEEGYDLRLGAAVALGALGCRAALTRGLSIFADAGRDDTTRMLLARAFWWGVGGGYPKRRAVDALFACVMDSEQPPAVRAEAAVGLGNMLAFGSRNKAIYLGLVDVLVATAGIPGAAAADLKYQLLYAIEQIGVSIRSTDPEVRAVGAAFASAIEKLLPDETQVDGESLGAYAAEAAETLRDRKLIP